MHENLTKDLNNRYSYCDFEGFHQTVFLQNFTRYVISDYFFKLQNHFQNTFETKISEEIIKMAAICTYIVKQSFTLKQFQNSINSLISQNSLSIRNQSISVAFTNVYSTSHQTFNQNQLVIIQTCLKADNKKLNKFHVEIIKTLEEVQCLQNGLHKKQKQYINIIKKYNKFKVHIIFIYFGNKFFYDQHHIQPFLWNNTRHIQLHVFWISRIALIQMFKYKTKLNVQTINEFAITYYENKRFKKLRKMQKKKQQILKQKQRNRWYLNLMMAVGTGIGLLMLIWMIRNKKNKF